MSDALFVYGTLHPDRAPREIRAVVRRMKLLGKGTVVGSVYDLGEYPALVNDSKSRRVSGTLFALPDDPDALKALDAYEEYLPEKPAASLFLRQKRMVTMSNGSRRKHWVYVYNRAVPNDALLAPSAT